MYDPIQLFTIRRLPQRDFVDLNLGQRKLPEREAEPDKLCGISGMGQTYSSGFDGDSGCLLLLNLDKVLQLQSLA